MSLRIIFCLLLLGGHFGLLPSLMAKVVFQEAFPQLNFERPVFVIGAPELKDHLFVVEQAGVIRTVNLHNPKQSEVVLDIRNLVSRAHEEEGLLGLALDPQLNLRPHIYVYYAASSPRRTLVARYSLNLQLRQADPSSAKTILSIAQPYGNHKGGMIAFGPDQKLYIGVGDGGDAGDPHNHGQDLNSLLGKILRIDVHRDFPYSIPTDNPWVNQNEKVRREIWAYGLRNPWRFSFDHHDGKLWAADVGQNAWEEIDIITKGGNYGWRLYEGAHPFNHPTRKVPRDYQPPVYEYPHSANGGYSVTGGYVYRGNSAPYLKGYYIFGDYVTGHMWALQPGKPISSVHKPPQHELNPAWLGDLPQVSSFGEDAAGELYFVSLAGKIYRLQ